MNRSTLVIADWHKKHNFLPEPRWTYSKGEASKFNQRRLYSHRQILLCRDVAYACGILTNIRKSVALSGFPEKVAASWTAVDNDPMAVVSLDDDTPRPPSAVSEVPAVKIGGTRGLTKSQLEEARAADRKADPDKYRAPSERLGIAVLRDSHFDDNGRLSQVWQGGTSPFYR